MIKRVLDFFTKKLNQLKTTKSFNELYLTDAAFKQQVNNFEYRKKELLDMLDKQTIKQEKLNDFNNKLNNIEKEFDNK